MRFVKVIQSVSEIEQPFQLTIFIASYNRLQFIRQCIDSFVCQSFQDFNLVVSDNSTTNTVENFVISQKYPKQVYYLRRTPPLAPNDHFKALFRDGLNFSYFVLFHDDDWAEPDYVEVMLEAIKKSANFAAVGPNAWAVYDSVGQKTLYRRSAKQKIFTDPRSFIAEYFLPSDGMAPFPGYMYSSEKMDVSELNLRGGKHMDVYFLSDLVRRNPVLWLPKPLINYRYHSSNDSNFESIRQRKDLLAGFLARNDFLKSDVIYTYFRLQTIKKVYVGRFGWMGLLRRNRGRGVFVGMLRLMGKLSLKPMFLFSTLSVYVRRIYYRVFKTS